MCKKWCLWISLLVMVVGIQAQAEVLFSDNFDHVCTDDWLRINYQGWYEREVLGSSSYVEMEDGSAWSIGGWDGYQSLPVQEPNVCGTIMCQNVATVSSGLGTVADPCDPNGPMVWMPGYDGPEANGVLRMVSTFGNWEQSNNSGPFLYKMVEGDFTATVEIVAYDTWWYHISGIMARVPNPNDVGSLENHTQVCIFPMYEIANRVNDTTNGVTDGDIWGATTKGAIYSDLHLKLERVGNTFFYYTSPDGETWASLPGVEEGLVRDDFPAEVQVGLFQCNFNGNWMINTDFDNFVIEGPAE